MLSILKIFRFNQLPRVLIDYHLCVCGVLIKTVCLNRLPICFIVYLLVSKSFVWISFYFNQLLNVLIDYHGLRGGGYGIFNCLRLRFNRLFIAAFSFE